MEDHTGGKDGNEPSEAEDEATDDDDGGGDGAGKKRKRSSVPGSMRNSVTAINAFRETVYYSMIDAV